MTFDIRLPIGLLFLAIGLMVAAVGAFGGAPPPGDFNIDLVWGLMMTAFGGLMLAMSLLAGRQDVVPAPDQPEV